MNENTTLREVKQSLRHNRKVLNDILEAGLGIGLEELIRKGVLNAESNPHGEAEEGQAVRETE